MTDEPIEASDHPTMFGYTNEVRDLDPSKPVLTIVNRVDEPIVQVFHDGRVAIHGDVNEAAERLWGAVHYHAETRITELEAEVERQRRARKQHQNSAQRQRRQLREARAQEVKQGERIEELKVENEKLCEMKDGWCRSALDQSDETSTALRQRDEAVEVLRKHGRHDDACSFWTPFVEVCNCGFDLALVRFTEEGT